ncbi:hypothetical protein C7S13_7883 [Burkholderia cepacia]|nr:hypothetical protein [Burkholderia cepacia]
MSTRRESRLRAARIVGLLMVAVVLTIATGWFVVYGLIMSIRTHVRCFDAWPGSWARFEADGSRPWERATGAGYGNRLPWPLNL